MLRNYTYAIVYAVSSMVFIAVIHPTILADYARAFTAAAMVVILLWMAQSAAIYQRRYHAIPEDRRARMMKPKLAWAMGASSVLSFALNARAMFDLLGEPIRWYGVPAILVVLALSAVWLYPLIRHERVMEQREQGAGIT